MSLEQISVPPDAREYSRHLTSFKSISPESSAILHDAEVSEQKESLNSYTLKQLTPDNQEEWHQYGLLRAAVYIDQKHFLDENARNENGEEFDEDDGRAIHVGAFKCGTIVGAMRLIERSDKTPLPVEEFFGIKADQPSVEMSRFIVDKTRVGDDDKGFAAMSLIRSAMHLSNGRGGEYVYATLEPPLCRYISMMGINIESLSELTYLEEYNSKNLAVRINTRQLINDIENTDRRRNKKDGERLAPFFRQQKVTHGLGRASLTDLVIDQRRFERNRGFLSKEEQTKLANSSVAIAGAGGDGGQLAISLAQMGIGEFRLADPEEFDVENLNRQAGANYETVGRNKAEVIADEILRINPWARVNIYREGITTDNVEEFVKGSDLVLDETDFEHHVLGAMLARAARRENLPVTMALNIGYGARLINFHPEKGETYESWLGLSEDMTLEEIEAAHVPVERWIGKLPNYANIDVFKAVQEEKIKAPSLAPGVMMAAGIASTQAQNILLGGITPSRMKNTVWAPNMTIVDPQEGRMEVVNAKSQMQFKLSAVKALVRTLRGKNPPYDL